MDMTLEEFMRLKIPNGWKLKHVDGNEVWENVRVTIDGVIKPSFIMHVILEKENGI
jgi:hypothetical protein